jgi:arylformamidase
MTLLYDVSLPIGLELPVWPGDPPVAISRSAGLPAVSELRLSSHAGTHVDAPAHCLRQGIGVDQLPLAALIGPAWVVHLPGPGPIAAARLAGAGIPAGASRLLIRTDPHAARHAGRPAFDPDFAALAPDAAAWLIARGVRLVGIDAPSIEPFAAAEEFPVHQELLAAGMIIVENLALDGIAPGPYQLICLPLRIIGGDGAPARVVLARAGEP